MCDGLNPTDCGATPDWLQSSWLEEVLDWIRPALAKRGLQIGAPIPEPRLRPWAAVLTVPTNGADVYFKASRHFLRHESAVTTMLGHWHPDSALQVLASDPDRGWLLMPDGGTSLRQVIRDQRNYLPWESILPKYARLQIDLAERVPDLLDVGVPDRRLALLPSLFEGLLLDEELLYVGHEKGLAPAQVERLHRMKPIVDEMCRALAGHHIAETLHHGDLHDNSIFLKDGRPYFLDWGDCSVSHPFFSLRTTFVSLYSSLQIDDGAPELDQLRDIYLSAWQEYEPMDRLLAAFELSRPLAAVSSALVWHHILSRTERPQREQYVEPIPALLQEFLELSMSLR